MPDYPAPDAVTRGEVMAARSGPPPRRCEDCGGDIGHRPNQARLCEDCAAARDTARRERRRAAAKGRPAGAGGMEVAPGIGFEEVPYAGRAEPAAATGATRLLVLARRHAAALDALICAEAAHTAAAEALADALADIGAHP